ncbi:hypothetical protein N566_12030, partial [Streptomycetaceae bacterium MP113-05]
MGFMTPRPRSLLAAAVAACAAVVVLVAPPVAASEGGAPGTTRPRDAVTLTPASGAPGTPVAVRARCGSEPERGAVFSPAFAGAAALHPAPDGSVVAEATVRRGLPPGRSYVVTANCSAGESLTTTFVTAADPHRVHRAHRVPVARAEEPEQVDGVALAFGGGLAGAALAGYLLTTRRTARRRARAGVRR